MTSAYHHVGLDVKDIVASLAFYEDALDGRLLTRIRRVSSPFAGIVMGSAPATEFDQCRIGFDGGGCVELFQFIGDLPDWMPDASSPRRLPHFGVLVDDVAASLKRVERAGGKGLWPEIEEWGPAHTMYASDIDNNVFELCDATSERIVEILIDMYPECDPLHGAGKARTLIADGR